MSRAELVVSVALSTGWPPAQVRAMTLRELSELMRQLKDRARRKRMAESTRKALGRGRH